MPYPKKFMNKRELSAIGFPEKLFYQICNTKGSPAFKTGTGGKTSQWVIDTDKLDAFLQKARNQYDRQKRIR